MIRFESDAELIEEHMLHGFFEGWPNPPSPENHLRLLRGSDHVVLAIDDEHGSVIGFITAISDSVMSAYIPLLEVLPAYRGQGIGRELAKRMIQSLEHLYMVDVMCDPQVVPFYEKLDMTPGSGAMLRNYARQSCTAL